MMPSVNPDGGAMQARRPHDPYLKPEPTAPVFWIDHARAEKQALFERETDTAYERRALARMMDGFGWSDLAVLLAHGAYYICAVIGLAWLVGRLIASIEAGVWL
jgi:hypothetical protein